MDIDIYPYWINSHIQNDQWKFIDEHLIDHVNGEWFTKVNRLGVPFLEEPKDDPSPYYRNDWKIDPWKAPYHNGRAMIELISRIEKLAPIPTFPKVGRRKNKVK